MRLPTGRFCNIVLGGIWLTLATLPLGAIVRWNEAKDQIYVTGSAIWVYDSNIFTNSEGVSDSIIRGSIGAEYRRQAGLIGVNADLSIAIAQFTENEDEGFSNPNMRLEFTKDSGRTTGTLAFSGNRTSRADPAANMRTDSWNYGADFRVKYPISDRHSFSGGYDWQRQDYENNQFLVDLNSHSMSADWFYVFSEERDLFSGYRLRLSDTSAGSKFADHSVSAGVAGRLIRGLNGTARMGYQIRKDLVGVADTFLGFNATITGTWNLTRQISLTARFSKDLSVTSTNISAPSKAQRRTSWESCSTASPRVELNTIQITDTIVAPKNITAPRLKPPTTVNCVVSSA